ncbi:MAG: hypothetical protein E6I70_15120 [Chloroflexi bacterium]|nr:MAG: hypothetical protein E6I70_15120 [Chloroflexota bacterium]TME18832.1 MAG: hypothetical protein E6I63_00885 [Chloroflexota bacterium]
MRARFALIWGAFTLLIAGIAGFIGYQAGLASHVATSSGAVEGPGAEGWGFGFFGFIPFLLVILLLVAIFRRPRWYGGGPWMHGRGGWGGPGGPGGLESKLQDWHQKAHEKPTPGAQPPEDAARV